MAKKIEAARLSFFRGLWLAALVSVQVQAVVAQDLGGALEFGTATFVAPQPRQIAVILPETGRFAVAAEAIRAGIEWAQQLQGPAQRAQLRFYDAGEEPNTHWLRYQQAIAEGAEFVIGPLPRNAVTHFAEQDALPIPVLALNRGHEIGRQPAGLYQFGLNPEDEAVQVAHRAISSGYRRATLVAADTDLGRRIAHSFQIYFENMGGIVHTRWVFDPPQRTPLMDDAVTPPLVLRSDDYWVGAGAPDMLFLAVEPGHLAFLRHELDRRYLSELPMFSTSSLHFGDRRSLNDPNLSGIQYVDMPVLIQLTRTDNSSNIPGHAIREAILNDPHPWPRLIALGFDAYNVIPHIPRLERSWREYYSGTTGELRLDFNLRLLRNLPLAVIEQERALMREPISDKGLFLFF